MTIQCQVILPYASGLPRDVATNVFHFDPVSSTPSSAAVAACDRLVEFYSTAPPSPATNSIASYLSGVIVRANAQIKVYDLTQPKPRTPIYLRAFTLPNASGDNLPLEVACVASFQGAPVAGIPQGRRRNRVFIGPLKVGALENQTGAGIPAISVGLRNTLNGAMYRMRAANGGTAVWIARSSTTGAVTEIANGWVDNDPDTQRRRGTKATVRSTWVYPV